MITLFQNPQFGEVRVSELNNEPIFCLSDVCKILDLQGSAVLRRLSDDVISNHPIVDNLGRRLKTASLRYKLSQSNIRARIAAGEIPYRKVGSKYILSRNQLDVIFFK